jgi:hypothetical protein
MSIENEQELPVIQSPTLMTEEEAEELEKSQQEPQEFSEIEAETPEKSESETLEKPESEIPEKYRGKSPEELIRMHQEAEKLIGKQGQQIGAEREEQLNLRSLIDDYIQKQTVPAQQPVSEEPEEDLGELYFTNPEEAVNKAISRNPAVQKATMAAEEQMKQAARAALAQRHPDFVEVSNSPEFLRWAQGSESRKRLLYEGHSQYNVQAASDLLDWYKQEIKNTQEIVQAETDLRHTERRQAATGAARASSDADGKKVYRRADILRLMTENPDRYYEELAEDVQLAYQEGRVR